MPAKGYKPRSGELRFDMFEAEYTHEGDRCTFEMLLQKSGLNEPALTAISEIVHDIDLKDGKFARAEAGGIAALIDGLAQADISDQERVERGAQLFDNLYAPVQKITALKCLLRRFARCALSLRSSRVALGGFGSGVVWARRIAVEQR